MKCPWGGIIVTARGESQALLMKPAAVGMKLFLWCEVLALIDCSLMLERRVSKSFCLG